MWPSATAIAAVFLNATKQQIGPAESAGESMSTGVACHIYSAAEGGPRGQGNLSRDQLADIKNALWLCANHARNHRRELGNGLPTGAPIQLQDGP